MEVVSIHDSFLKLTLIEFPIFNGIPFRALLRERHGFASATSMNTASIAATGRIPDFIRRGPAETRPIS
jgi:hypothetical protein